MRVFLDANVLFSGAYSQSGPPARVIDRAAEGPFVAVLSSVVIDEAARNLARKVPDALPTLERVVAEVNFEVVLAPADSDIKMWLEAGLGSDAAIVAAAAQAGVDYLCTGDRGLLRRAGQLGPLRVISPAQLIALLDAPA